MTPEKKEKIRAFVVKHKTKIFYAGCFVIGFGATMAVGSKNNRYPYGSGQKTNDNALDVFLVMIEPEKVSEFKPRLLALCEEFEVHEPGFS